MGRLEGAKMTKKDVYLAILAGFLLLVIVFAMIFWPSISGSSSGNTAINKKRLYGYFDTEITVYDYTGSSKEVFNETVDELGELFNRYHKLFDIYHHYSGVVNAYDINAAAGGEAVAVDREMIDFLKYAKEIYQKTGGEVNVAMGAVLSLWHDVREESVFNPDVSLPSEEALASAGEHISIDLIEIDEENSTVRITDPEASLDLGALGKGYAAERAAELLLEKGITVGWALDVGGTLRVIGSTPSGEPWRAGIKNPDKNGKDRNVYTFNLQDASSATSGDYERYFIKDGVKYHHIIDKDTFLPPSYFVSVTAIVREAALADALSTALFCMSYEDGLALVSSIEDARCVWITESGEILKYGE